MWTWSYFHLVKYYFSFFGWSYGVLLGYCLWWKEYRFFFGEDYASLNAVDCFDRISAAATAFQTLEV